MRYIGIDPGKSGGIAVLDEGGRLMCACKIPATEKDVYDVIHEFRENSIALIEHVHGRPGHGSSGMFNFGRSFGGLRMALIACAVPFSEISPVSWQKMFGLTSSKKRSDKDKKNANKACAQELFPEQRTGVKVTHLVADSMLIAEACRRQREWT